MSARAWKTILCLLGAAFLAASAVSIGLARRGVSSLVDEGYYLHGLQYGAGARSWSGHLSLQGEMLELRVRDAGGAPVTGGCASALCDGVAVSLIEGTAGCYRAALPRRHGGIRWRFAREGAELAGRLAVVE